MTLISKTFNQSFLKGLWHKVRQYHTKFGGLSFSCPEDIVWQTFSDIKFCCDLDLEYSNPFFFFLETLLLMIMYLQTKFGSKKINSSEDIVLPAIYIDHMSQCWDLNHDDNKPIFFPWNSRLWWYIIVPSLVTKIVQRFRTYCLDKHPMTYWIFVVILTLNAAILFSFFHKTLWLMMEHHHMKFGGKRFRRYCLDKTFIDILKFCCDLEIGHNNLIVS